MDPDAEADLRARVLAAIRDGMPDAGGGEHHSDVSRYLSEERFERERSAIFRATPQLVAHAAELGEPGAFLTLEIAGAPLLVCRDADERVRAFLNVCRHRGTRLVDAESGCQKRFTCPYHAWTYGLDGALVGVPQKARGFPTLNEAESGLVEVASEERHGLVWVSLDASAEAPLDVGAFLGDFDRDLAALGLEELEPFRPHRREWRTNWKLVVEGGLEAYHFPVAHRSTIAPLFEGSVFVADRVGDHFRSILPKRSMKDAPEGFRIRDHANVLYTVFPNAALLAQSDHVACIRFVPLAVDRTEIQIALLVPAGPRPEKSERHWEKNHELTVTTLNEDFALAESIQSTLRSGANDALRFGRFEHLLAAFHETVERYLGS